MRMLISVVVFVVILLVVLLPNTVRAGRQTVALNEDFMAKAERDGRKVVGRLCRQDFVPVYNDRSSGLPRRQWLFNPMWGGWVRKHKWKVQYEYEYQGQVYYTRPVKVRHPQEKVFLFLDESNPGQYQFQELLESPRNVVVAYVVGLVVAIIAARVVYGLLG